MDQIAIEATAIAVLADGATPGEVANARGDLLEKFVARLLESLGFSEARTEHLKVTSEGIEIDVVARQRVTHQRLIAECKAYSSNVRAPLLTSFLGKYLLAREDDQNLAGLFVALPRLTAEAKEQADAAEKKFANFRSLASFDVCELLVGAGLLPSISDGPQLHSDLTVVVTAHGLALAARELDDRTRRPIRLVLWRKSGAVPDPVVELVKKHLAEGLPVVRADDSRPQLAAGTGHPPTIVPVRGSSSDFEYQLPAGPEFFVGRKRVKVSLAELVRSRETAGSIVINAKSGWGKSSLALRLGREVENAGGVALVVDTRTAERRDFVAAAMETLLRKSEDRRLLAMPEETAYGSLSSIMGSLRRAAWSARRRPLLIVFDQFENVFRDESLTREFRDLAVLIREIAAPVTVGFAWKTDLVGWTEDHPYRLRDEIRATADVAVLDPFGPREIETLLRRLEKTLNEKLDRELRQRLRELSQGLPWLFKKLASHIKSEVERGASQEELVRESLNVQALFENDLAELSPAEQEGLRTIARSAPAVVSELEEAVSTSILQSLLNRRLVVQVGERIDTYWDTFRDFLLTGQVAIEDSYMIRYGPVSGVSKLLRAALAAGGDIAVPAAANALSTSPNVIWNFTRELRQFGLVTVEPYQIRVDQALVDAPDREAAIRARVAAALRRHKIVSVVNRLLEESDTPISLGRLAGELPHVFPAVEANTESWITYARAFAQWLAYAGLVTFTRDGLGRTDEGAPATSRLLSGSVPVRVRSAFPQGPAGPAEQLLRHISDPTAPRPGERRLRPALRDLSLLGAVELDEDDNVVLTQPDLMEEGSIRADVLRPLVESMPGAREAMQLIVDEPAVSPAQVGAVLRAAHGAEWADSTTHSIGKYFRSWARACGISTATRVNQSAVTEVAQEQLQVDFGVVPHDRAGMAK